LTDQIATSGDVRNERNHYCCVVSSTRCALDRSQEADTKHIGLGSSSSASSAPDVPCYTCYSFGGELGFERRQCLRGETQTLCFQSWFVREPTVTNESDPSDYGKSNPVSHPTRMNPPNSRNSLHRWTRKRPFATSFFSERLAANRRSCMRPGRINRGREVPVQFRPHRKISRVLYSH
jgi:hypothetical protein